MTQLPDMTPAFNAHGGSMPSYWLILTVVVLAFILPMAYLVGRNGGRQLKR